MFSLSAVRLRRRRAGNGGHCSAGTTERLSSLMQTAMKEKPPLPPLPFCPWHGWLGAARWASRDGGGPGASLHAAPGMALAVALSHPWEKLPCTVWIFLNMSSSEVLPISLNCAGSMCIFRAIRDWLCRNWWKPPAAPHRSSP